MVGQTASVNEPTLPIDLPPLAKVDSVELDEGDRIVKVLIDEPAIDRRFDYIVPAKWADLVQVGSIVRVDIRHRRVRGWVTAVDADPPPGVALQRITKVTGLGPPPGIIDLAEWAAESWVGRVSQFLRTASPPKAVDKVQRRSKSTGAPVVADTLALEALSETVATVRLPPADDPMPFVLAAAKRGKALILAPNASDAHYVAVSLRRAGIPAALMPGDWDRAAGGEVTVGTRAAAFAPVGPVGAVVVLDEHDEAYTEEAAPTWNARDVAIERARRDGAPCVLISGSPSLEALEAGTLLVPSRSMERAGWPVVDVVDRTGDDPATGEWCSEELSRTLASGRSVACVINRKGRARFPICHQCGHVPRSDSGSALTLDAEELVDRADGSRRPVVCERCGSTRFRRVRLGVSGVREELEAMARRPVAELTKEDPDPPSGVNLYVGTEAMLHRLDHVDVVAFLDFDQELLAPRFRAGEQAMALLLKAARLVGPRSAGGRLLVQTRTPDHEVLQAALHADPARFATVDAERRTALRLPPFGAMALVSGQRAEQFMHGVDKRQVFVSGPDDGSWMVTADDRVTLTSTLRAAPRPQGRLRIEIDPRRV